MNCDNDRENRSYFNFAPWSLESSLKEKTAEVGINYDDFIEGLRTNRSDTEMAEEFTVPEGTIRNLREHFESDISLNSIVGH